MNNNKNTGKRRILPIIFVSVLILLMLPVIISLIIAFLPAIITSLPIFFLGLSGLLIFILVMIIICKSRKVTVTPQEEQPQAASPSIQQPENEISIIQKAFGLLQRRITEQLAMQYPGARWVWNAPNAMERFKNNDPLFILLNSTGGYNKAQVGVHNLLFTGIFYGAAAPQQPVRPVIPAEPVESAIPENTTNDDIDDSGDSNDGDDSIETGEVISEDTPVNYGRLAFEWLDANMEDINAKYNEAIAKNQTEMLIPAEDLPHPDSWPDICEELKHNGFAVADFCDGGIQVNITN